MNGDHSQISDNFVERIRQAFSRLFDSEIVDRRQYGNCLGPCYLTVVMDLPDSLRMNCKSGFGFFFLMFPPRPRESASVVQWLGSKSIDQKVMGLNPGRSKEYFSEQKNLIGKLCISACTQKYGSGRNHRS